LIFPLPTAWAADSRPIHHGRISSIPPPKTLAHLRRSSGTSAFALANGPNKSGGATLSIDADFLKFSQHTVCSLDKEILTLCFQEYLFQA